VILPPVAAALPAVVLQAVASPDSAIAAAARYHEWLDYIESWHEFYLMAGTAAVTLAGLLFVAISIHIETLIHETRQHLLVLARAILFSFVMVLTLSLMMLVPPQSMKLVGAEMLLVGVVFTAVTVGQLRARVTEHPDFPISVFRRRLAPTVIGYAIVAITGAALILLRESHLIMNVIGAICMVLGNAVGASWELLVRTAKIKRRGDV
jgi:hypothetical protein